MCGQIIWGTGEEVVVRLVELLVARLGDRTEPGRATDWNRDKVRFSELDHPSAARP